MRVDESDGVNLGRYMKVNQSARRVHKRAYEVTAWVGKCV